MLERLFGSPPLVFVNESKVGTTTVRAELSREIRSIFEGAAGIDEVCVDRADVTAEQQGCGELELTATPGTYFFRLGRQDELLGHRAFDDRFIVKTNDAGAARFWIDRVAADAMLATFDPLSLAPFALSLEPGTIRCFARTNPARIDDRPERPTVNRLDDAINAVGVLANRGERLADEWRGRLTPLGLIAAGSRWRADDAYSVELERGRSHVRIDFPWQLPAIRRRGLRTRARIARTGDVIAALWRDDLPRTERPTIDADDRAARRGWHARATSADATLPDLDRTLEHARPDWVLVDHESIAIGWESIVENVDQLGAAMAALARWAEVDTSIGPFR